MGCAGASPPIPLAGGLVAFADQLVTKPVALNWQEHRNCGDGEHTEASQSPNSPSVSLELGTRHSYWRAELAWPFSKREVDPFEREKAIAVYRRLFTQPRKLATLRAEFDAAVHEGSENGTTPELLEVLQGHASKITTLMNENWGPVVDETQEWPRFKTRKTSELADGLCTMFAIYVEKTLRWLDYFVIDPSWLNLTAVNYAANAAREAASEVREIRIKFEQEFELTRDDLAAGHLERAPEASESGDEEDAGEPAEDDSSAA